MCYSDINGRKALSLIKAQDSANFRIWPPNFFEDLNQKSASEDKGFFSILKRF